MKALLLLMLVLPAHVHAQMYKWTDANGTVHYSDRPQDGVTAKSLQVESAPVAASNDNWRERERISRQNRARQAQAERRLAAAEESEKARQQPFNPSMNRSDKPMTDDELCTRDRQQIEFAEKTKNLTVLPLGPRTEAQRQEIIRERKANHALACAEGRRR